MANMNEKRPAGINDNEFEITNVSLAKAIDDKEAMRTEKGPEIGKKEFILSTDLKDGVIIQAKDGGRNDGMGRD